MDPTTATSIIWRTLSLTHVRYPVQHTHVEHLFSKCMAFVTMMPLVLVVAHITLVLFRRDLATMLSVVGLLWNEALNAALKRHIAEPRPKGSFGRAHDLVSHGMPSSHAQFMCFFTVVLLLRLYRSTTVIQGSSLWRHFMALYWITITLLVMYSRVFLHYHTVEQVIAGGTLGAVCAIFHHVVIVRWLVDTHVWPYLSQENATTARWLRYWRVRDTTHVPDVIGVEYEAAQKVATEKLAKQAKRVSLRKLRKAK